MNNENSKLSKEDIRHEIPVIQAKKRKITSDRDYTKLIDISVIKTQKTKFTDNKRDTTKNDKNQGDNVRNINLEDLNQKGRDKVYDASVKRVEMTSSERKREMEKIRDRELFGVHGHDSLNEQMYRKKNSARTFTKTENRGKKIIKIHSFLIFFLNLMTFRN